MCKMNWVNVNGEEKTVWVGGGALTQDVDKEISTYGLWTTTGIHGKTGAIGNALHGGYGALSAKYGLAVDQILAADVITADGKLLHVDAKQNSDLFWALRGAGSYFGIVVQLKLQLYPALSHVYGGTIAWDHSHFETLVNYHFSQVDKLPAEFYGSFFLSTPPEMKGATIVMGLFAYLGSEEKGKELVDGYRKLATPLMDQVKTIPYALGFQQSVTNMFTPASYYHRSRRLKDAVPSASYLKILAELLAKKPASVAWVGEDWHGISQQKDKDFNAFPHRKVPYNHFFMSIYPPIPLDEKMSQAKKADREWIHKALDTLKDHYTGCHVAGYGMGEDKETWKLFWGDHYERLTKLKEKYDPSNLFFPLLSE